MATGKEREVLGPLRVLFRVGTYQNLTDGQLLERFATDRGEAGELALAALVERHGPMVLRVCRSVLADPHEAQDAFQATFLVLVRKGRGLWVRESLGPWLHQVAYRTARCARSEAARRRRLDRLAARARRMPQDRGPADMEPIRLLHEEIERLPERDRAPVILCDLEGCTHEQAARHLGWPIGTVKSRLSRARQRLRDRLIRRGLDPGAGLLLLSGNAGRLGTSSISASLADATAVAASQFLVPQAIARGSAAVLAQGVLHAMNVMRWWKLASFLVVLGAAVPGAVLLSRGASGVDLPQQGAPVAENRDPAPAVLKVQPDTFRVEVRSRGVLEPVQSREVVNPVEGQTTVLSILPQGTLVKKGDLVCELESAFLRDQLENQQISTKQARSDRDASRADREAAENALRTYEEVALPLQEEALAGRIAVAEAELALGQRRVERLERAADGDDLARDEARLAVKRAELAVRQAKGELRLLREYTKEAELYRLRGQVARAASLLLNRESRLTLEEAKEAKMATLRAQIEKCRIRAPGDGMVDYRNTTGFPTIEEGMTVRERQWLFRIVERNTPMRAITRVPEAVIAQVRSGQRARIRVDAFPDRTFAGTVRAVAPVPDIRTTPNPAGNVYTTLVEFDERFPELRSGMTADVEILVDERDGVLSVPLTVVVRDGDTARVAVRQPGGGFAWREVTLGQSDDRRVEIKTGLAPGESVALDPNTVRMEGGRGPESPSR